LFAAGDLHQRALKGLTANSEIERGLFPLRKSGVSVQPMIDVARAFLVTRPRPRPAYADVIGETWRAWAIFIAI
jgi:hypothetical protein